MEHKAGFVNIIGNPNVGKSTLMNALVGEKLSIITSKAQTTRHRIMGIVNGEDFQIIYSDLPGILTPNYKLQEKMMKFIDNALNETVRQLKSSVPADENGEIFYPGERSLKTRKENMKLGIPVDDGVWATVKELAEI